MVDPVKNHRTVFSADFYLADRSWFVFLLFFAARLLPVAIASAVLGYFLDLLARLPHGKAGLGAISHLHSHALIVRHKPPF